MPRIIVKCRYYQKGKTKTNLGGMVEYIAKRDGVCKLDDGWKSSPVTKKQQELIDTICKTVKNVKRFSEYDMYEKYPTRGTASEFISFAIETYSDLFLQDDKTYLDYIATRPRAERIANTHGLFSDDGVVINLVAEVRKLNEYDGKVYSVIISIKRDDAERLGFNNASRWRDMIRAQKDSLARAHNIPLDKLKWYGAFHNESHHPHVHLLLYSSDEMNQGYLTNKGIEAMRRTFGKDIFRADIQELYDEQTYRRNMLTKEAIDEFNTIADNLRYGLTYNPVIIKQFAELSERLQTVKGKKVYGYLPRDVKLMVNSIVDELEKDKSIKRLYDLWYEAKCAVENTYTDNFSSRLPLSQENVFKPIRNAVVKRASELGDEFLKINTEQVKNQSKRNVKITESVLHLGSDISNTFRERFYEYANDSSIQIDSKLKSEIEAKKRGQRIAY